MNQTFIFKKHTRLIAGIFAIGVLQFASSCKTTDDPTATKKDSIVAEQVYKDVEYASMTSSLSVARGGIQATTIGNKTYFIGGNNFGINIPPNFIKAIDVFDGSSLSWSTEAFPSGYDRGTFIVTGSKIFFTGPTSFEDNNPSNQLRSYDLITKTETTFDLSSARFVRFIGVWNNKAVLATGNDVDIIDLSNHSKISTKLPGSAEVGDLAVWKGKAYFAFGNNDIVGVYDITLNTWSTINIDSKFDRIAVTDDKLILTSENPTSTAPVHVYDLTTNTKTQISLSTTRIQPKVTVAGNMVFFAGGIDLVNGRGYTSDVIDIYNTRTNAIRTRKFSVKRGASAGAVNGKFVLFAGGIEIGITSPYPVFKSVDFFILNK